MNYVWNRGLGVALARLKPDVLLVGGYGNLAGIRSIRWAVRAGRPWVLSSDTRHYDDTPWLKRQLKQALLPRLLSTASGYITFGEPGERYLRSMGVGGRGVTIGSNRDLVRIARATDAVRSGPPLQDSKGAFIYVGRLVELKGVDLLLEAFSGIYERVPGWRLLIAGDGPLRERVVASARGGVPVDWLGAVPFERLPEVLARADVLVVPSRRDAWGLVVSEAMAAGLPVIASSAVGSADHFVRTGETGWMFTSGDRAALERLMLQATSRNLSAMRLQARELALKYDVRRGSAAVAALFRGIAWQRPGASNC